MPIVNVHASYLGNPRSWSSTQLVAERHLQQHREARDVPRMKEARRLHVRIGAYIARLAAA
jgi:hypothetical protein